MSKIKKRGGFTLAELLIVIAIMAILIAIAMPVFSAQLDKAKEAVDKSTARSAISLAEADYLLNHSDSDSTVTYYYCFTKDENDNLTILTGWPKTEPGTAEGVAPTSNTFSGKGKLQVTVESGGKVTSNWAIDPTPTSTP